MKKDFAMETTTQPEVEEEARRNREYDRCWHKLEDKIKPHSFQPRDIEELRRHLQQIPECQQGVTRLSNERAQVVFEDGSRFWVWVNQYRTKKDYSRCVIQWPPGD